MKRWIAALTSVLLVAALTMSATLAQESSTDANRQLVIAFVDQVFNAGNVAVADQFITADYIQNTPGVPSGSQALQGMVAGIHTAFPDIQYTVYELATEGDYVAARMLISGTQEGDFMGIPATGNRVAAQSINFWRVENGKLAEHWEVVDQLSFFQQLGIIPNGAPAPEDLSIFGVPLADRTSEPASTAANADAMTVVKGLYSDALNLGDVFAAERFIAPDYVWHNPFVGPGLKGFQDFYTAIYEAFPDVQREINLTVTEGDLVFVLSTITGTHEGGEQLYGIPPTFNPINYPSADVFRVSDSLIVEQWDVGDYFTLFQQIGLIPAQQ
jgi:steroid delta-isomerase-like uncharacterized protein